MSTTLEKMQGLMRKAHADAPRARRALSLAELAEDTNDGEVPSDEEVLKQMMEAFGLDRSCAIHLIACIDLDSLRAAS
ncbi:hypothetical protein BN2497_10445 [Janthinobacterium sp. CG23_2]|nr:hypothetical protein BN2497_83 [Janthinobacterium sp. CG23_2]CUI07834.1 hypothetical protein BN2497_10445 [Janthinobacterium sp. CG23_2]CUU26439.1 hypothetical protein BN3177_83 [Janthinobacterium sp. CG23_2]CUU31620.1 hypothetical protein BN3177_10445 [Janthinobacterium sp. CG23_2]